jgi:outer membrane protein assembly factor BamA
MKRCVRTLMLGLLTVIVGAAIGRAASQTGFTPRKLLAIAVNGTQRFNPETVAAASGLVIGATAGEDDFRRAAERLGDSGAFTDVTYSYTYSDAGAKLTLEVKDAVDFVPARFEDFVGFTDDELRARIKQRLPLFDGNLPASGKLAAHVSDVLQGMLIEKQIPGRVEYDRMVREDGGKVQAILYSVEGVAILIRKAQVSGGESAELPRLQTEADRLKGRDYKRSILEFFVEKQLLPVLHERGYIRADVKISPPLLVSAPTDSTEDKAQTTYVDIEFVVNPGSQYRLAGVQWTGNKAIPTEKLAGLLRARSGELANTVQVAGDLERVRQLYGSLGYIRALIKLDANFDASASTVQYVLVVTEDERYKMGELEIRGVDRTQDTMLREAWKIRAGEVYDAGYLQKYLPAAVKMLPKTVDWTTTHHITANVKDKTVDVEVDFVAQAPK